MIGQGMNILFIFGTGSEVRQFLHSGIISELVKAGNKVFISAKLSIADEARKVDVSVIELPWYDPTYASSYLSRISKLLDLAFEHKYKYKEWRYDNRIKKKNANSFLIQIATYGPIYYFLIAFERFLQESGKFISKSWLNLLLYNNIDKVVTNAARNYPLVFFAAQKLKIPTVILFHTNKDIYAQGRLFFHFKKYGVWNQEMANELMSYNSFIKKQDIEVIGCAHFSYLAKNEQTMRSFQISNTLNIDNKRNFLILYTAADPRVILNEILYVKDICESIEMSGISNYRIFVRTNPMDFSNDWESIKNDKVFVLRPKWFYDPKAHFNYTMYEDLEEFSSLLKLCHVCINIPSTVTVECAITNLPVINICYNNESNKGCDILKFWNALFYKNVIKYGAAIPAHSKHELRAHLENIANGHHIYDNQKLYLNSELGVDVNNMTENSCRFILMD